MTPCGAALGAAILATSLPVLAVAPQLQAPAPPTMSLWYRGSPAGTPTRADLEAIRAAGFTGVTWPAHDPVAAAELSRLAADVPLRVTLRIAPAPLTPSTARQAATVVDVGVGDKGERIGPLAWRAVAYGASVVSLDPGATAGTGLAGPRGPAPWIASAHAVLHQLANAAQLIADWRRLGTVRAESAAGDALDLSVLEDARSWVLVVTNVSSARVKAVARLPAGLPSALWVNLIDGGLLSMIAEPAGARWALELEPWAARVYVVRKGVTS